MKARSFEFSLNGIRGFPAMLLPGLVAILVLGLITLVVMAGAVVAVAGLAVSAGAALYYGARRRLAAAVARFEEPSVPSARGDEITEVREIEVEILPGKVRR